MKKKRIKALEDRVARLEHTVIGQRGGIASHTVRISRQEADLNALEKRMLEVFHEEVESREDTQEAGRKVGRRF